MADELYDPKAREASFRSVLQRAVVGLVLFLATLATVIVLPVFPIPVSIALAIALGVIGYKFPLLGEMLTLYLVLLSVTYQFELPLALFLAIWIFFSLISLQALRPGGIFAVSCGVIAAMLMTSPLYWASVPIMLAAPLVRGRGRNVGSAGAILVFLALYLLLLVHNAPPALPPQQVEPPVPLFGQTTIEPKPRLSVIEIEVLASSLKQSVLTAHAPVDQYLNRLSIYFPVFQSGSRNGVLIIVLGLYLAVSVAAAFGILEATRWIRRREVGEKVIPWLSPIAALLGGEILFLILLTSMTSSFSYKTPPLASMVGGFALSGLILGSFGAFTEYWLKRRDMAVSYQEEFLTLRSAMETQISKARERAQNVVSVCTSIDIGTEEFAIRRARQDLSLSFDEPDHMSLGVLSEKLGLFKQESEWLGQASADITAKVRQYYDDSRQRYLQYVAEFSRFGFSISGPVFALETAPLNSLETDRLLEAQVKLNANYRFSAEKALGYAEAVGELIRSELDHESASTGLSIGRSYFEHGSYGDALDTLAVELVTFDRIVLRHADMLLTRVASVRSELSRVLRNSIPKTVDGMGDPGAAERYAAVVSKLDRTTYPKSNRILLGELSQQIDQTIELAATAVSALSQLSQALSVLDQAIESKSPSQYNWGKDTSVKKWADDVLTDWAAGQTSLAARLLMIERASVIIEKAALTVTRYGRVLEFFVNYVNIEYLIQERIQQAGRMFASELPVKDSYALQYARLFREHHDQDVVLDESSGQIIKRDQV